MNFPAEMVTEVSPYSAAIFRAAGFCPPVPSPQSPVSPVPRLVISALLLLMVSVPRWMLMPPAAPRIVPPLMVVLPDWGRYRA